MIYDIYLYTLCYYICCLLGACMRCTRLCPLKPGVTLLPRGELALPNSTPAIAIIGFCVSPAFLPALVLAPPSPSPRCSLPPCWSAIPPAPLCRGRAAHQIYVAPTTPVPSNFNVRRALPLSMTLLSWLPAAPPWHSAHSLVSALKPQSTSPMELSMVERKIPGFSLEKKSTSASHTRCSV
jgi:hypothetical protein